MLGLAGLLVSILGFFATSMIHYMKSLSDSIQNLNIKIAQILAHMEVQSEKINELGARVTRLEDK